jgi:GntR family transcriptional regulator
MLQFRIQLDSDISASAQLFNQIRFAIASRQYSPGHRLPSTRQLAMLTGLHRNTISKVYQQLEEDGLVESLAGSGIYVKAQGHEGGKRLSPVLQEYPAANALIQQSLDSLTTQGLTLSQIRELFLAEIDWRIRCGVRVLVTAPESDLGVGELILQDLEQSLAIPVELVPLEELAEILKANISATVVTNRYFMPEVEAIALSKNVRVIPIDVYNFQEELGLIKTIPKDQRLGIVSLSTGILRTAELLVYSLRGDEILILTAQTSDRSRLNKLVKAAHVIISDPVSYPLVQKAITEVGEDMIRLPQLISSKNYVDQTSIEFLKRELGV